MLQCGAGINFFHGEVGIDSSVWGRHHFRFGGVDMDAFCVGPAHTFFHGEVDMDASGGPAYFVHGEVGMEGREGAWGRTCGRGQEGVWEGVGRRRGTWAHLVFKIYRFWVKA